MKVSESQPSKWPRVRLAEVAEHCLGKMLDAAKNKGRMMPYLRNPNVRWFEVDLENLQMMPFEPHEHERYGLRAGDVVICEGGEAGRAAIWDGRQSDLKFQKAIHRVRPGPRLHNRFLVHRLFADHQSGRLSDYLTGATIKHLTGQDLANYEFALPPLDEQRRIADILDKADALRAKRRAALAELDTLTQAIFLDMFGDPVENPQKFSIRPMIELVDKARPISYGILMPGPDQTTGVPYVRVVDMRNGGIDLTNVKRTTQAISDQYRRSLLREDDLLMSIRGHVGRLAIVPPELTGANITQDTVRLAILGAEPVFVCEYLRTASMQQWLATHTKGMAVRGINLSDVKRIPVALPALPSQALFARTAERISQLRNAAWTSLVELDSLFAGLQDRAFRGEL